MEPRSDVTTLFNHALNEAGDYYCHTIRPMDGYQLAGGGDLDFVCIILSAKEDNYGRQDLQASDV